MSRDADAKPEARTDSRAARLYDKRTVERNIKKGLITRKDYEKHMKSLEDVADKGLYGGPPEDFDEDLDDDLDEEVEPASESPVDGINRTP